MIAHHAFLEKPCTNDSGTFSDDAVQYADHFSNCPGGVSPFALGDT